MKQIIDSFVGLVAPHTCLSCGKEGSVLCEICINNYHEVVQPRCAGCRALSKDFRTCRSCQAWLAPYAVIVASSYESVDEKLVHVLKYEQRRQAYEPMVKIMSTTLRESPVLKDAILCPVPTAQQRVRERGFDQASLLVDGLSKEFSLPIANLLIRKNTTRQVGSSRKARFKHMNKAFGVKKGASVKGRTILLIDDVVTTGATLSAATKCLKKAGAKRVYAAVFAQK